VPFGIILKRAWDAAERERRDGLMSGPGEGAPSIAAAMSTTRTSEGVSLLELTSRAPVLVIFLRHLGCTFCRETLADVARAKPQIENAGIKICLVHMVDDAKAANYFTRYNLADAARVSDPAKALYEAFELSRGTLSQLFGPRLWIRGFKAGLIDRHLVGTLQGDGLQLPGAFLVHKGEIVRAFRHADAADRPDYCELAGA
jgi:peroxiredoxin